MKPLKLAVLGSSRGTVLESILQAMIHQKVNASVEVVVSDRQEAYILQRAHQYHIPAHVVSPHGLPRNIYDQALSEILNRYEIDLILLIGFMRILSKEFVDHWWEKIINVHPSLLPKFPGLINLKVHEAVIKSKSTMSGCTIHYVTHEVDSGPIIIQKTCPVLSDDTPQSLKIRVQHLEGKAFIEALNLIYKNNHSKGKDEGKNSVK